MRAMGISLFGLMIQEAALQIRDAIKSESLDEDR